MRQRDLAVVGCAHSSAKKTVSFRLWLLTLVLYVVLSLMELLGSEFGERWAHQLIWPRRRAAFVWKRCTQVNRVN